MSASPSTAPSPRDTIINRIRKLSKFTIANGCTEAEALNAAARIAELIRANSITESELSLRADASGCITDEFCELRATQSEWMTCAPAIAKLYSCKVWVHQREDDWLGIGAPEPVCAIKYFGFPHDVAAAVATSALLYNAIKTELHRAPIRGRTRIRSFSLGMAARVHERILVLIATRDREAPRATAGNSLIVVKDAIVTEEFAKQNIHLRTLRSRSTTVDPDAYSRGKAAGERFDIGERRAMDDRRASSVDRSGAFRAPDPLFP